MDTTTTILLILMVASITWAVAFHLGRKSRDPEVEIRDQVIKSHVANIKMMQADQEFTLQSVKDLRTEFAR